MGAWPFDVEHVPGSMPGRLAFGHDWTQGPTSFDGKPAASDYYATGYLNPNGEGGKHAAYGGFTRDRPLASENLAAWSVLADYRTVIRACVRMGLDGIASNLMSTAPTSPHTARQRACLTAADEVPGFTVLLQPDMNTSLVNLSAAELAKYVITLAKGHRSAHRDLDGHLVVSPFKAEAWTVAKWQSFVTECAKLGEVVALWPCLVDWPSRLAEFAKAFGRASIWGDRSAGSKARMVSAAKVARDARPGCEWMAPIAVQDYRPGQGTVIESEGFAALAALVDAAIEAKAEKILLVTLNDYSEHTNTLPSANAGDARAVMVAHHLHRWRHGTEPTVARPATIVSQRPHAWDAVPTEQTKLAAWRGGTPVNICETLTFTPGKPLQRTVDQAVYPAGRPTRQDLTYHSVLTVAPTPVDPRDAQIVALMRERDLLVDDLAAATSAAAAQTSRANAAEQVRDEQAGRLRNIHALSDIN